MIAGQSLQSLATQIQTERAMKRDFVVDTKALGMTAEGKLHFELNGEDMLYTPTRFCTEQICDRVQIPRKYAERLQAEAPALLATNVNHWFDTSPEKRMFRTFTNGQRIGRAFLSDRYRPLDNYDLATYVLPKLEQIGCEVKSCQITETNLYIQAVTPRIKGEVKVGDEVYAGIVLRNSEVGKGSLLLEPMTYHLRCTNGMVLPVTMRKHHVGRGKGGDLDEAVEYFSDATRRADDKAFWMKVCDMVEGTIGNQEAFDITLGRFRKAAGVELKESPTKVVELIAERFMLNEGESENVLTHLAKGGDLTQYGLLNAVTRTAQDADSYDRAIELERVGGQILELKPSDLERN